MYHDFYNLTTDPFRLSPDHRFCFGHRSFKRARTYMEYALQRGEGFVMVTGEPGTGKSTLIEDLFAGLRGQPVVKAKLVSTQLVAEDLLRMVAFSFGINAERLDKATLLKKLTDLFTQHRHSGRRVLLVVDEAQDLAATALEELRLLTNLQEESVPLLQIFLVGQQQLRDTIHSSEMEQVHQRIVAACHLEPLKLEETRAYVEHRLHCAGWSGDPCMSDAAFYIIRHFSDGVPRRINLICSRLLLHGSVEELHKLTAKDVRLVLQELHQERLITGHGLTKEVIGLLSDIAPAVSDDCVPRKSEVSTTVPGGRGTAPDPSGRVHAVGNAPTPAGRQTPARAARSAARQGQYSPVPTADQEAADRAAAREAVAPDLPSSSAEQDQPSPGEHRGKSRIRRSLTLLIPLALIGALLYGLDWDALRVLLRTTTPAAQPPQAQQLEGAGSQQIPAATVVDTGRSTGEINQDSSTAAAIGQQDRQAQDASTLVDAPITETPDDAQRGYPMDGERMLEGADSEHASGLPANETSDVPAEGALPETPKTQLASKWQTATRPGGPDATSSHMDAIERAVSALDLAVVRLDDGGLKVNLRSAVPFTRGSAEISVDSRELLDRLAAILKEYDDIALRVVGHTDQSGPEEYNMRLSEQRAAAVGNYLRQVTAAHIPVSVEGRGSTDPVALHEGIRKELNRRTVLYIEPVSKG